MKISLALVTTSLLLAVLLACGAPRAAAPTSAPSPLAAASPAPASSGAATAPVASAPTPAARQTINLGVVNLSAIFWPLYAGLDEGIFDRAGFDVELVVTRSSPDGMAAMLGGSLELNVVSADTIVLAQTRGADAIGVAGLANKASYSLIVQPEIQQITDLRGKTLGASALRAGEVVFLKELLKYHGLTENDYNLVVAGPSRNRVSAMTTHQIDGTIMPPPDSYLLEDAGLRHLGEVSEAVPEFQFQLLAVTRSWAQANEDTLIRFLRAYSESLRWLYDPANKERAIAILAQRMNLDDDHARRTYTAWVEQEQFWSKRGEFTQPGLDAMEQILISSGEATPPLPPRDRYTDSHYLERAMVP